MKDLAHKLAQFFRGEDFGENGEDARLEFTPAELREIAYLMTENARLKTKLDEHNKLNELPAIHQKKGRWIPVTNGRGGHECDQCHEYAPSYQSGEEHLSDFCPNCGADMRGEQDE